MSDSYPVTPRNEVRQLRKKAIYDRASVHAILDAAPTAVVGFVENGNAVVVPMLIGRDDETLYLHGARKARVIRWLGQTNLASVNVTLVDGIVLARSAFNSSMHYRSATVFGKPRLVDDPRDKLHALRVISEHTIPGRWDELRAPLEREIRMTGVIALDIESASAKISAGMPEDEEEDYAIPIWAGVLPLTSTFTKLVAADRVAAGVEPSQAVTKLEGRTL